MEIFFGVVGIIVVGLACGWVTGTAIEAMLDTWGD